jgi:PAS domain S-box-containing protein
MGDAMKDDEKTREQLIHELSELRSQNAELKKSTMGIISIEPAAEEARHYAESIVETIREPLLVLDADLKIVSANRKFYTTFKVTPGETIGSLIYDLGNKQWDIADLRKLLEEVLPEKQAFDDFEVDHIFQDIGHKIMLLNASRIYRKDISATMILLAIEDITERKRLEDLLTESEERFRRLFETASDGIVLLEKGEGKITHANPATEQMLGYTNRESIGNKLQDIGVSLDLDDFQTTMEDLNKSGIINYRNVTVETKSGQHIDTEIYLVDRAKLVQCNIRDITERRRAEEALRESEELFRSSLEYAPDGVYMSDVKGTFLYGNRKCEAIIGYKREELIGKNFLELNILPEKSLNKAAQLLQANTEGKSTGPDEIELISKEGRIMPVEISTSVVQRAGEGIVLAFVRDITDRKQAEERLFEKEQLLSESQRLGHIGSWFFDMNGTLSWSEETYRLYGVSPDTFTPTVDSLLSLIHPDDQALMQAWIEACASGKKPGGLEFRIKRHDGTIRFIKGNGDALLDVENRLIHMAGTSQDITERREAEDKIKKQSDAMESAIDGIAILNKDEGYTYLNEAHARIFGYENAEELIGKSWRTLYDAEEIMRFEAEIIPKFGHTGYWQGEALGMKKDGSKFPQAISLTALDGGGLICIVRDITERKQAEEELRESEERFRRIFDEGPFGMGLESPDHTIVAANKALCELLGYTEQELAGQNSADITHEEDREKSKDYLGQLFADGTPVFRMDKRYIRKDGTILWANTSISAIHGKEGNVLYGLAIIEDLTDSRKAADKIHRLAFYDGLTGLPNRTFYKELICKKVERCLQYFGIKVLDQFFLGCEATDAFVGFYPVIKVDESSQLVLAVG